MIAIINTTSTFCATKIRRGACWTATVSSRFSPLTLVAASNWSEKHAPANLGGSILKVQRIEQFGIGQTSKPQQKVARGWNKTEQSRLSRRRSLDYIFRCHVRRWGWVEQKEPTSDLRVLQEKYPLPFRGLQLRERKVVWKSGWGYISRGQGSLGRTLGNPEAVATPVLHEETVSDRL